MQTTFLTMQTSPVLCEDVLLKAQKVFQTLMTRFFDAQLKV